MIQHQTLGMSGQHYVYYEMGGLFLKNIDRMGVLILAAHLIITLAFIAVYTYTLFTGQDDDTLRTILTVIVGYWFGALGKDAIKRPLRKDETHDIQKGA